MLQLDQGCECSTEDLLALQQGLERNPIAIKDRTRGALHESIGCAVDVQDVFPRRQAAVCQDDLAGFDLADPAQPNDVLHPPKLVELNKKAGTIITPEQRKARSAASKKAKADGKKGKAARAAVNAAVKLSAEQKKALAEVNKARQVVIRAARAKFVEILTDEQKAKLPKKKGKKKKKKKKADA